MGCTHSTLRPTKATSSSSSSPYDNANATTTSSLRNLDLSISSAHDAHALRQRKQNRPHKPPRRPSRLLHSLSTLSLSHAAYAADVYSSGSDCDNNDGDCEHGRRVDGVRVVQAAENDFPVEGEGEGEERKTERMVSLLRLKGREKEERQTKRVGLPRRASLPSVVSCGDLRREYLRQESREVLCIREE